MDFGRSLSILPSDSLERIMLHRCVGRTLEAGCLMVGCLVLAGGCTSTSHVGQAMGRGDVLSTSNTIVRPPEPKLPPMMANSPTARISTGMELDWAVKTDDTSPGVVKSGRSIVGPDGTAVLGPYGSVHVAGLSLEDASLAMEKQMANYVKGPKIAISTPIPANQVIAETPPHRPVTQVAATDKDIKAPTPWRPSTATVPMNGPPVPPPSVDIPNPFVKNNDLFVKKNDAPVFTVFQMPPPKDDPLTGKKPAAKTDGDSKDKGDKEPEAPARLRTGSSFGTPYYGDPNMIGLAPHPGFGGRGGAPDELNRVVLPPYVIGPPDVLQVESLRGLLEQPVRGQHLVRPDGSIGLGVYGSALVAGMTLDQAKDMVARVIYSRIQENKKIKFEDVYDGVSVDVVAYNSKVYYVILDGAGLGEQVIRLPFTGNETVLDALSQVQGLPPQASKKHIWVARRCPAPGMPSKLDVDWNAVVQCGDPATNWQIMPGDRVYVRADGWRKADNYLAKWLAPVERLMGATLLGSQTVNSIRRGTVGGGGGLGR